VGAGQTGHDSEACEAGLLSLFAFNKLPWNKLGLKKEKPKLAIVMPAMKAMIIFDFSDIG
jgi:hypothetical protein